MLSFVRPFFAGLVLGLVFSSLASAQTSNQSDAIAAIQNDSDAMRKELINRYRTNPLFGDLLSRNSKIKGAARRLQQGSPSSVEIAKMDQLVFDLESTIEEANFRASSGESKTVSRLLGQMVASIEAAKLQEADPGSLNGLLNTEFEPQSADLILKNRQDSLTAPLIMGPDIVEVPAAPLSVMEEPVPVITQNADPGELVLPDLTMPTPGNTDFAFGPNQTVLKPQLGNNQDQLELLPFDNANGEQVRIPTMQAPQPLTYGIDPAVNRPASLLPFQIEFFSSSPIGNFGYQPYGGYFSPGYGGYRGYGTGYRGGRNCPSGRW